MAPPPPTSSTAAPAIKATTQLGSYAHPPPPAHVANAHRAAKQAAIAAAAAIHGPRAAAAAAAAAHPGAHHNGPAGSTPASAPVSIPHTPGYPARALPLSAPGTPGQAAAAAVAAAAQRKPSPAAAWASPNGQAGGRAAGSRIPAAPGVGRAPASGVGNPSANPSVNPRLAPERSSDELEAVLAGMQEVNGTLQVRCRRPFGGHLLGCWFGGARCARSRCRTRCPRFPSREMSGSGKPRTVPRLATQHPPPHTP